MSDVSNDELVARLLFFPQMVRDDVLTPSAFPMDELLAKKGKNGVSLDRFCLLEDPGTLLHQKAQEFGNPNGGREPFGYCTGEVKELRSITDSQTSSQAFEIVPDQITDNDPPKVWDRAHALMLKANPDFTKANLRGSRDKLIEIFSPSITRFAP